MNPVEQRSDGVTVDESAGSEEDELVHVKCSESKKELIR